MSNSDHNANPSNPMKKRFRSWQPDPGEQPRPRRRYPRLVVRDRTGNHIANDIATAPKVELPLKPIVPRSITIPTSSVSKPDDNVLENVPSQQSPSKVPTSMDSPECSASTQDRGAPQMESQRSLRSPSSPLLAKSTAVNHGENVVLRTPSRDVGFQTAHEADISPQQPVYAPVSAARVNPMPAHAQAEYPPQQYALRPRPTTGGYVPYGASSCAPEYPAGPMVTSAPRDAPYSPQPLVPSAPQQPGRPVTRVVQNVVQSTPPRSNICQSQASVYGVPQTAPPQAPAPVESYPSENIPQSEKIILAGKRCGTVEYWRSSLQMPREKGVVKSVKLAQQPRRRVKQGTPERTLPAQPTYTPQPPHSTSVPAHVSPGYAPAYAPQRSVHPAEYDVQTQTRPEQNPKQLDQTPRRPGSEIEHEFWRTATKLPRASAETTRVKRLANGRRRIDGSNADSLREGGARSNDTVVTGSPVSGPRGDDEAGPLNAGLQTDVMPAHGPVPVASASGAMVAGQAQGQIVPRRDLTGPERVSRAKAESETRRLLFLRDFELRRLRTLAQSKFHVKMNLRGRMKLEQWVCSDPVTMAAADVVVTMFNLDRRVLSKNDDIRRNSLYDMTNEDLRILEALMSRISSRGGRTNWALLTSSLSHEDFVTPPTAEQL